MGLRTSYTLDTVGTPTDRDGVKDFLLSPPFDFFFFRCWYNERLKTKTEGSKLHSNTGLHGGGVHLNIETRLTISPTIIPQHRFPQSQLTTQSSNVRLNTIPPQIPTVPYKDVTYWNRIFHTYSGILKIWNGVHQELGDKDFQETFIFDRSHVVSGALLMTVAFVTLMLSQSDYLPGSTRNTEVTIVYLVVFGITVAGSLGVVLV